MSEIAQKVNRSSSINLVLKNLKLLLKQALQTIWALTLLTR